MDALQNQTRPRPGVARRHPVRLTALFYFVEALRSERYEECAEILAVAREFGASEKEIQNLLEDRRRIPV